MKKYMLSAFFVLAFFGLSAQQAADDILGQYWTEKREGKIEIFKQGDKYFGKIAWRKEARKDTENPDESLRNRNVIGIIFLQDFVFDGKDEWEDGTVYSIDNGGTYSGRIWLEDDGETLKMRGYMGISLLGRTATLKRAD
ncbi:MAG: DUF2147 domain-containing protein [Bacteroidota bacterium]